MTSPTTQFRFNPITGQLDLSDTAGGGGGGNGILTISSDTGGQVGPNPTGNMRLLGSQHISVDGDPSTFEQVIDIKGFTQFHVVIGGLSGDLAQIGSLGLSGYTLTSQGPGLPPIFAPAASPSPLTTKGDTYGYTTTNARVPVGANGYVYTADNTQPSGTKWAPSGGGSPGNQIAFYSYLAATLSNSTGDGTVVNPVPFDTITINYGSGFNPSTGVFTVPAGGAGNYAFSALIYLSNLSSGHTAAAGGFLINGSTFKAWDLNPFSVSEGSDLSQTAYSGVMTLNDGDTVQISIQVGNSTKTVGISGTIGVSYFSGFLINSNSSGDVSGPSSSIDNHIAIFDGVTGKLIKDSGFVPTDFLQASNNLSDVADQPTALNNIMPPTPSKGTIAVFDGTNWANLPVGTDTYNLTANSGASNGVDWEPPAAGGSTIGFTAYVGTTLANVTGNSAIYDVIFDSTTRNDGTCYNTSTGVFTAPLTGLYSFNTALFLQSGSSFTAGSEILVSSLGSVQTQIVVLYGAAASAQANAAIIVAGSWMVQMTAGDTMKVQAFSNSALQDVSIAGGPISPNTFTSMSTFSGFKVA